MSLIKLNTAIRKVLASKSGATMVEYAIIVAVVAVAAVGAARTVGTNVSSQFTSIAGMV